MSRRRKRRPKLPADRYVTIDGDRRLLTDWAKLYGKSIELIMMRLRRGWSPEMAVTKPARKYRQRGQTCGQA